MKLKDFDYNLPKELIAQEPIEPRDHSRLLVFDRQKGKIDHKHFYDLIEYLRPGDVLVLNNTKVMKARLIGRKATGGKIEIFLLKKETAKAGWEIWQCLVGGPKRKEGLDVRLGSGLKARILNRNDDATWKVEFNKSGRALMNTVKKIGQVPLPPYIKRQDDTKAKGQTKKSDEKYYQTVYANEKKLGSVAAPTAGLHFTPKLLSAIKKKGVKIEYITLQVGLGTFAPVKTEKIEDHKMHHEYVEVKARALKNILAAKKAGGRVVAVGTTSVRTLESLTGPEKIKKDQCFATDIYIYPGYSYKIVDAMITNFHLPKSTLLMLISAFAGRKKILEVYEKAIRKKYKFFSYGDAMLIK